MRDSDGIIKLAINDMEMFIYLVPDSKGKYIVKADDNISFLLEHIWLDYSDNVCTVYIDGEKFCEVANIVEDGKLEIEYYDSVTSTRLRALESNEATKNILSFDLKPFYPRTELHTHLVEILPDDKFLDFIKKMSNADVSNESISIDFDGSKHFYVFSELENKVVNRVKLINSIINMKKEDVLVELLIESLVYLSSQGIIYTEISYSSIPKLKYINEKSDYIKEELLKRNAFISYELLVSFDRNSIFSFNNYQLPIIINNREEKKIKKDSKRALLGRGKNGEYVEGTSYLEELLNSGAVRGIDIMGKEYPFITFRQDSDYYNKLKAIITILNRHPNSVFRVHAGEFAGCIKNVEYTLEVICSVLNELGIPYKDINFEIRIGHAINIEENDNLTDLIKKLNVIIEVNISSNFALKNVEELDRTPIPYYWENGIKFVISTDGGGMYNTTPIQEFNIVASILEDQCRVSIINLKKRIDAVEGEIIDSVKDFRDKLYAYYGFYEDDNIEYLSNEEVFKLILEEETILYDGHSDYDIIMAEIDKIKNYFMNNVLDTFDYDINYIQHMLYLSKYYCENGGYLEAKLILMKIQVMLDMDITFMKYYFYFCENEFDVDRPLLYVSEIRRLEGESRKLKD